jgi:uncharacterized protein YndB with AHSA1/START domain
MSHPNLLALNRSFAVTPSFLFTLWSNPALVSAWWGPEGHHLTTCEIDVRPGGKWRFNMARDGADHWAHGTYHEEFGVRSVISIRLEAEGQGTRMRFLQTGFPDAENHAGHAGGWSSTFAILEDLLLKLHGIGSVYPSLPQGRVSGVAADLAEARRRHDAEVSAARP